MGGEMELPKQCAKCDGHRRCVDCEFFRPMCDMNGLIRNFKDGQICVSDEERERFNRTPTIREMLDTWYDRYAKLNFERTNVGGRIGTPRARTVMAMKGNLRRAAHVAGISLDEKLTAITRKRLLNIVKWYEDLKVRKAMGEDVKVPSETTVRCYLDVWSALCSRWVRELADYEGKIDVPKMDIPEFHVNKKKWRNPTKAMKFAYSSWLKSIRDTHPKEYMMVMFQRVIGVRNGDLNAARWDNFSMNDGTAYYTYTDSKAQKSGSVIVPLEFFDMLLSWRKYMYGKDGPRCYYATGHEDDPFVFGGYRSVVDGVEVWKHGTNCESWKFINKGMKACGICAFRDDVRGAYQNRAMFGNEIREQFGEEAMNYAMHNSHKVTHHYSAFNPDKLKGRTVGM